MVSEVHSHSKILGFYFRDVVFFYIYIYFILPQMVLYCSLSTVSLVHTLNT